MILSTLVAFLQIHLAASPQLVALPTDVAGSSRGAAAASFDPAATGRIDGIEVQLRQRGGSEASPLGAMGAYGSVPLLGPLSLSAGYEWGALPQGGAGRGTLGLATELGNAVWAGIAYRGLRVPNHSEGLGIWDVGLFAEPASWL